MFETIATINFILWVSLFVIMLVGNLTYADYYTKFDEELKLAGTMAFAAAMAVFIMNFLIASLMRDVVEGFKYGLYWFSGASLITYLWFLVSGMIYCFKKLKAYFGKKRGKI